MESTQNQQEVLLLEDKQERTLGIVSEIDKMGKVKTVAPKDANSNQFLKINSKEGLLQNFMGNFLRQYNAPTRFGLYKIAAEKVEQSVAVLAEILKSPKEKNNANTLKCIAIKFGEFSSPQASTTIEESHIDEKQFQDIGVDLEYLKKLGELDRMLKWQKTDKLIPIVLEIGDATVRTEAPLALRENQEGNLHLAIHAIRKEPDLERLYMGVQFTDENKKNLLATGNLGREVELKSSEDNVFKAFVSIDRLTNELLVVRSDRIRIPDDILGVQLSEVQKQDMVIL